MVLDGAQYFALQGRQGPRKWVKHLPGLSKRPLEGHRLMRNLTIALTALVVFGAIFLRLRRREQFHRRLEQVCNGWAV